MNQRFLHLLAGALLTLLFYWMAGNLGPMGVLLLPVALLPPMYVHLRHGLAIGAGTILATTALLVLLGNPSGGLVYLLQFGVPSLILPFLLRRQWLWDKAAACTLAAAMGMLLLFFALQAGFSGTAMNEAVQLHIHGEMERALAFYTQADLPEERLAELQTVARGMGEFLLRHYPGITVAVTGLLLLVSIGALALLARGRFVIAGPPLRQWKLPEATIWLLIPAGAGALLADGLGNQAAMNLLVVLLPLYFLQGLAVLAFFFQARGFSPVLRAFAFALVTLLHPLPFIVAGVGVFDLWADFRKPRPKQA